jgi:hypothetical protein
MEVMAQPARALAAPVAEFTRVSCCGKGISAALLESDKAVSGYNREGLLTVAVMICEHTIVDAWFSNFFTNSSTALNAWSLTNLGKIIMISRNDNDHEWHTFLCLS